MAKRHSPGFLNRSEGEGMGRAVWVAWRTNFAKAFLPSPSLYVGFGPGGGLMIVSSHASSSCSERKEGGWDVM